MRAAFRLLALASLFAASAAAQTPPASAELWALDADGVRLDPARSHASLSRTLPAELGGLPGPDRDAFTLVLVGPPDTVLEPLQVLSFDAEGRPLDVSVDFRMQPATCPDGVAPELVCFRAPPLRLTFDEQERQHPALRQRSLRAQIGGKMRVSLGKLRLLELSVGGPRRASGSAIERLRARVRVLVLRSHKGGAPAVGGTDTGARQVMQRELASAAAIWGQCGVELSERAGSVSIQIVDPPATQLLNVGCGLGQPASGGTLRLQSGRNLVTLATHPGEPPVSVALRLAPLLGAGGKLPRVFENARNSGAALGSADVLLDGSKRWERSAEAPLSTDATLPLCLGQVDLSDGLSHFSDGDAFVGTLEERTLLRSLEDGDPRSIEVLVVPELGGGGRIGESFIVSPGSSLPNSVIIDRSAISAGARSFALAHELGHLFLSMPGHPDDFGVDQSWSLMDADVADGSIFGPRRLSAADCERALTQTGPTGLTPLLEAVPLR
jgi:hypothetical protein